MTEELFHLGYRSSLNTAGARRSRVFCVGWLFRPTRKVIRYSTEREQVVHTHRTS